MEERKVNRTALDKWLAEHGPDGISRLAVESGVSASTIQKIRYNLVVPKKLSTLQRLSEAMGIKMDVLFPEEQAS